MVRYHVVCEVGVFTALAKAAPCLCEERSDAAVRELPRYARKDNEVLNSTVGSGLYVCHDWQPVKSARLSRVNIRALPLDIAVSQ